MKLSKVDHLTIGSVLGGFLAYFLYGALTGDLYFPGRFADGVHLKGAAAWVVTCAPLCIYTGILMHGQVFGRWQPFVPVMSHLLMLGGVGLLFAGIAIGR